MTPAASPATSWPVGYRSECECTAVLVDGSVARIRPIRPDDADALAAFHDQLSAETVYRRFLGPRRHLSATEVQRFSVVDYDDRLALIAECDGRWAAVSRYDRTPGEDWAEVAFVVADDCQHLGLGTLLLEHLALAARRRGITSFVAETLGNNFAMQGVFHAAGFPCVQTWESGVADVRFPIELTDAYLAAVTARDRLAVHARLAPSVTVAPVPVSPDTDGPGLVGVACRSPVEARRIADACRAEGLAISVAPAADVSDLISYFTAETRVDAIVVGPERLDGPRRLVVRAREAAQRKPVLALAHPGPATGVADLETGGMGAAAWAQAGVEVVDGARTLASRVALLVRARRDGVWAPPPIGRLIAPTGCDASRARGLLDAAVSPGRGRRLAACSTVDLLASYGVRPASPPSPGIPGPLLLTVGDDPGSGLVARLGCGPGPEALRFLPLTDRDAAALVALAASEAEDPEGLVDTILRAARLVDDLGDVSRLELELGSGSASAAVWVGPARRTDDDPVLRRIAVATIS